MSETEALQNTALVSEAQPPPSQDYDRELLPGDYWVKGSTQVIALILEANQYGVIFQTAIIPGLEGEAVFDFEAGQNMMPPSVFRDYLRETQAEILEKTDRALIAASLKVYQLAKAEQRINEPKTLPKDQAEFEELEDVIRYRNKKQIIPPPRLFRKKRALHWLIGGPSGSMVVAKLWDPVLENWVFGNGVIDQTASIGFIKSYHGLAALLDTANDETYDEFVGRLITFLTSKGFLFDAKFIASNLKDLTSLDPEEQVITLTERKEDKALMVPFFSFSYAFIDEGHNVSMNVYLAVADMVKYHIHFPKVLNREFIPNDDLFIGVDR